MIIIEREALLSVLSRPPLHLSCEDEDEYVLVSQPKGSEPPLVCSLRPSTSFDDDMCSLASTACSELSEEPRKVSFSGENEIHIVERFYQDACLSQHFYSYEDTQRFRSEYRLERKLLAELDVDPSSHQEELSGLFATNDQGRHNISRVVVLHNDKIETFCNPEQAESSPDDFFDNDSFWSGSITW
eukprot:CAMPEP_0119012540 /NCGR_PEP_ID=MMETSP1176-20130426/6878_1 /TAXON_ID=265551 /ORGANISM="Synedropsis recta cf, Strain CCMP1620" /LENGTH=185 /DNA_ID=CAMNT_0006965521 /DNA_START=90 /DNA_END=644 /DNA_ORIENTATION=+